MKKEGVKKAEGLPLTIIIIAVILLLVLVIISSIFSGNIGKFSKDIQSCGARNGECLPSCGSGQVKIENVNCPERNKPACCVTIFSEE